MQHVRVIVDDVMRRLGALPDDAWAAPASRGPAGRPSLTSSTTSAGTPCSCPARIVTAATHRSSGVRPRPNGPAVLSWRDPGGGTTAVVASAPPDRIGWHPNGDSDAGGFAAMGITETTLHTHDILTAQGHAYRADETIETGVLDWIFPDAPRSDGPWHDLLHATGRTDNTRGRPWRWDCRVRRPT